MTSSRKSQSQHFSMTNSSKLDWQSISDSKLHFELDMKRKQTREDVDFSSTSEKSERKENQDVAFTSVVNGFLCAAVFDGHGKFGKLVAETTAQLFLEECSTMFETLNWDGNGTWPIKVTEKLNHLFETSTEALLGRGLTAQQVKWSGTTATVLFLKNDNGIVANVGDSEAFIGERNDSRVIIESLSSLHRPSSVRELERIESKGARIIKDRVYFADIKMPGLMITRAIGDQGTRELGVICTPAIKTFKLKASHLAIVLASDGIWDYITTNEVCKVLSTIKSADEGSKKLVEEAIAKQTDKSCDNTTAIVILLEDSLAREARIAVLTPKTRQSETEATEQCTTRQEDVEKEKTNDFCVIN